MEMEDHEYGMGDLRQFMNGRTAGLFTAISQQQPTAAELIPTTGGRHHQLAAVAAQAQHFEMLSSMRRASGGGEITTMPPGGVQFPHQDQDHHHHNLIPSDSTATAGSGGGDMDQSGGGVFGGCGGGSGGGGGGDGGSGRWPRQETLTLLEIRSSLDFKFKEANQKAPLWDQVSRIMCEEHGYHRSGKKCREKFENLYKYYKKTKEGKAGRQDGKHYRFFRQLEALYGETSNTNPTPSVPETMCQHLAENTTFPNQEVPRQTPRICDDTSPHTHSNSSAFDTSSSDDCSDLNAAMALKRRGKRSWKAKVRDFIDEQMRKLMEKQEIWLEKMTKTIEHKEHDRMLREEEWRKQDAARVEREHEFWAKERAWIEARDKGLMEALNKFTGITGGLAPNYNGDDHYLMKTKDNCSKKRKENNNSMSSSCAYFENNELLCNNQEGVYHDPDELGGGGLEFRRSLVTQNDQHINGSTLALNSNVAAGSTMQGGSFRFLMGDQAENLWEDYGLKLSKGHN